MKRKQHIAGIHRENFLCLSMLIKTSRSLEISRVNSVVAAGDYGLPRPSTQISLGTDVVGTRVFSAKVTIARSPLNWQKIWSDGSLSMRRSNGGVRVTARKMRTLLSIQPFLHRQLQPKPLRNVICHA